MAGSTWQWNALQQHWQSRRAERCLTRRRPLCARRFERATRTLAPLSLPAGTTAAAALDRVLRLPGVCSKRFLTTKVDRSVTGARCVR